MSESRLKQLYCEYNERYFWIGYNPSNEEIWKKQQQEYKELCDWFIEERNKILEERLNHE